MSQEQQEERAVVVAEYDVGGTAIEAYGSRGVVRELMSRLMNLHPAAAEVGKAGMLAVAQMAILIGANPLPSTNEIHVWVDKRGSVTVDLGVNYFRRRARELGGLMWDFEPRIMTEQEYQGYGVDPSVDIGAICRACRVSDLQMYLSMGIPPELAFDKAMERNGRIGIGTVNRRAEPKKGRPLAWTALKAAEKDLCRALFPNLEQPTAEEKEAILAAVPHSEPGDSDWDGPTLDAVGTERLVQMRVAARESRTEFEAMTPEEQAVKVADNSRALWGDPDFEGFDTPPEQAEPEPPEAWPDDSVYERAHVPDESPPQAVAYDPGPVVVKDALSPQVIRRVCRYKGKWAKGKAADWSDAVRPDPPPSDPIDEHTLTMIAAALNTAIDGRTQKAKDDKRHEVYQYLYGVSSGTKLTMLEGAAILSWIGLPDGKIGEIKALARAEIEGVLKALQEEAGQMALDVQAVIEQTAGQMQMEV
jgi:hypothetical protein